ncbi:MAG TPA: branched-chain amino acid ABC transporter permease [Thermoleophilia bacterium]|nr:branched-chain amino acid ABC transporter permease [Thermoleophilia bacterium]
MNTVLVTGLNGLSYAFILFLVAAGFSLTFGVMGVLNLSHGALYMLGAYFGLAVAGKLDAFWFAVVISALGLALVGFAIYYFFLKHLYGRVPEQGVLTIGLAYVIANIVLWIWGPFAKMSTTPEWLSGVVRVGGLAFPIYRLFIIAVGLVVLGVLWWMQDRTRVGAIIRAGMDNKDMTVSLGINYGLVSTLVFLFGIALAGAAGYLGTPILGAYPSMGDTLLLLTLVVVIVGGTGYIQGTMLGALIIGVLDTFGKAYFPEAALFTSYVIFIIVLLVRPSGLIGRKVF